jgi:DnaJ-class molecular chaperone
MAQKDLYLVLGISRGETDRGIQEAYRELAKRYHPDRAGPATTRKFQDIQEAYRVLSDPEKRRIYSHELEEHEKGPPTAAEGSFFRAQSQPEPLVPEPMSVLHGFQTIRPSFEPLLERFLRNFTGEGIPKGERLQDLNIEVVLSPEEAATGVTIAIAVPVFYTCRNCGGAGHVWLFSCIDCNGSGTVEGEETVRVRIPPMTSDKAIVEIPIHGLGIHNFYLCVHVRVSR